MSGSLSQAIFAYRTGIEKQNHSHSDFAKAQNSPTKPKLSNEFYKTSKNPENLSFSLVAALSHENDYPMKKDYSNQRFKGKISKLSRTSAKL